MRDGRIPGVDATPECFLAQIAPAMQAIPAPVGGRFLRRTARVGAGWRDVRQGDRTVIADSTGQPGARGVRGHWGPPDAAATHIPHQSRDGQVHRADVGLNTRPVRGKLVKSAVQRRPRAWVEPLPRDVVTLSGPRVSRRALVVCWRSATSGQSSFGRGRTSLSRGRCCQGCCNRGDEPMLSRVVDRHLGRQPIHRLRGSTPCLQRSGASREGRHGRWGSTQQHPIDDRGLVVLATLAGV